MESLGPHKVVLEQWISCAPFEKLLNMEILEANNGKSVLTMPFYYKYAQGAGLMHGGALIALADTAVAMAMKSILEENTHFATIDANVKFLYPVKKGIIKAFAEINKSDLERIYNGKAELFNDENIKVLEFQSSFKIARNSKIKFI